MWRFGLIARRPLEAGNKFNSPAAVDIKAGRDFSLATSPNKRVKSVSRASTHKSTKAARERDMDIVMSRAFIALVPLLASCASSGLYYMSDDWCERHLDASTARCPANQAASQELAQLSTDSRKTDPTDSNR
jgi:hypothetical protein